MPAGGHTGIFNGLVGGSQNERLCKTIRQTNLFDVRLCVLTFSKNVSRWSHVGATKGKSSRATLGYVLGTKSAALQASRHTDLFYGLVGTRHIMCGSADHSAD